ncbi:MAG: TRAP transporter substrate-binding protein, partial [bacterium]|nr:TRAP transporter substrate-binding protein [bacterium]
ATEGVLEAARAHHSSAAESNLTINALAFHAADLGAAAAPVVTRRAGVLRVAAVNQRTSPAGEALAHFAGLVAERTSGEVSVELDIPYGGKGRGETQALIELASGELSIASINCSVAGNILPAVQLLDLPFLCDSVAHALAVLDGPYGQRILADASESGLLALGFLENGIRHLTSNRPVRRPEDLRDVRLRVQESPLYLYLADALGAIPTPVPYTQLAESLRRGTVEAQENPLSNIAALRLHEVQSSLTLTAHTYSCQIVFANERALEGLGELRRVVEGALRDAMTWHRRRARDVEQQALTELRSRMQVIDLTPEERRAFAVAATSVDNRMGELVGVDAVRRIRSAAEAAR